MTKQESFCTCDNRTCPQHPTRHEKGCTPCIKKNLRLGEIPNCFFKLIENSETRTGDSFEDFARMVIKAKEHETNV